MRHLSLLAKGSNRACRSKKTGNPGNLLDRCIDRVPLLFLLLLLAQPGWSDGQKIRFDIPPSTAAQALTLFAQQADIQLLFPHDLASRIELNGIAGEFTITQAVKLLITDTCLEAEFNDNGTITLNANKKRGFWFMKTSNCGGKGIFSAVSAALAASLGASQASGQEAGPSSALEEIVVTAQKREQTLQDVPISVLVTTGEIMTEQNLHRLEDLAARMPNVSVTKGPASDQLYVRGVGSSINGGFEQSVGTFVDGIYHGRSRYTSGAFTDVERVEVLRGPQSIYFGNNAIGGAFNVTTRRPGHTWEGYVQAGWEFEHDEQTLEAAVGGPITDTFGVRVAMLYSDLDGYIENQTTGKMNPSPENKFGRVYAVWQPTGELDIGLKLEKGKYEADAGLAIQMTNCPPAEPFSPGRTCASALASPGFEADFDLNRTTAVGSEDERIETDFEEMMLSVDYAMGEYSLTAILGHTEYDYWYGGDTSLTPQPIIAFRVPEDFQQDSIELRVTSPQHERFDWIAGAYWQQSDLRYETSVAFHLLTPIIAVVPALSPLQPYAPIGTTGILFQDEETRSLFGALTWNFTDRLRSTVGLRWTEVEKDARQIAHPVELDDFFGGLVPLPNDVLALAGAVTGTVPHDNRDSRKDDDLIPSLTVQYDLSDAIVAYGSASEGFKAGGFDAFELTGDPDRLSFGPETVDAYEVGFKASWPSLSLNVAAFRNEYKDLQQSVAQTASTGITFFSVSNVGGLISKGLEVDLVWSINYNWRVNFSSAWLDASYEDYNAAGCTIRQQFNTPAGQTCTQDLSGESPPFAPDFSGNVGIQYVRALTGGLEISASVNATFTDEYDVISDNDPVLRQEAYEKIDARLGLSGGDGAWEIAVLGKNLTDEWTSPFGQDAATSAGTYWQLMDRPRTIALQAGYNW